MISQSVGKIGVFKNYVKQKELKTLKSRDANSLNHIWIIILIFQIIFTSIYHLNYKHFFSIGKTILLSSFHR